MHKMQRNHYVRFAPCKLLETQNHYVRNVWWPATGTNQRFALRIEGTKRTGSTYVTFGESTNRIESMLIRPLNALEPHM